MGQAWGLRGARGLRGLRVRAGAASPGSSSVSASDMGSSGPLSARGALLASLWVRGRTPTRGLVPAAWISTGVLILCIELTRGDKGFIWIAYDTYKEDAEGSYAIRLWKTP